MTTLANKGHYLIDQQVQVTKDFLQNNNINHSKNIQQLQQFINQKYQLKIEARNTGSYQVILQQSLTTQDKSFLYEILIENDSNIIKNSLQNLQPKRVIQMLKMIKTLLQNHIKLGKGLDHCISISLWLQWLIKIHLSIIVSNPQNKDIIFGIRKFLQKKIQQRSQLLTIRSHLLSQENALQLQNMSKQTKKQNPKFDYIQEQKEHIEEEGAEQSIQIDGEDMEDLEIDQEFEDFLDDDF